MSRISKPITEQVRDASLAVPVIGLNEAEALLGRDNVVFVDVRDGTELAQGKVRGAIHASRGVFEFKADPTSPTHDPAFDPASTIILYCAAGGRAALAGKVLQDMGFGDVRNLGGFKAWADAGKPVDP